MTELLYLLNWMAAETYWRIENWFWHAIPTEMVEKYKVKFFRIILCSFEFLFGGTCLHLHSYFSFQHIHPQYHSFLALVCFFNIQLNFTDTQLLRVFVFISSHTHTLSGLHTPWNSSIFWVWIWICWNLMWNFRNSLQIIKDYNENLNTLQMSWEVFLADHNISNVSFFNPYCIKKT